MRIIIISNFPQNDPMAGQSLWRVIDHKSNLSLGTNAQNHFGYFMECKPS